MTHEVLDGFLSGYLHQDWDIEYADVYSAADDFGQSSRPSVVLQAVAEICELVASRPDNWEKILRDAGCGVLPPGDLSVADWLLTMAARMARAAIAANPPAGTDVAR